METIINFLDIYSGLLQIIVSIISIGIAIYVPFNVANKEKKLSLFEKRVTIYMELSQVFYNNPLLGGIGFLKGYSNVNEGEAGISIDFYSKEVKKLLTEASFLFSSKTNNKIQSIMKNRLRLNTIVDLTERGTSCFSKKDVSLFYNLYQRLEDSKTNDGVRETLKALSMKYSFRSEEFFDVSDGVEYDILSLLDEEVLLIKETTLLQEELINEIKEETHL